MKKLFLFLLLLTTPAYADVLVKTGTFDKTTGAASACGGSYPSYTGTGCQMVSGVGFQPKVLIFYTMGYPTDTLATTQVQTAFSWTSGPGEEYGSLIYWQGNVTTTDNNRNYQNTKIIGDIGGVGTAIALADLQSFDPDGFTLAWTTNSGGVVKIYYIAIGGSDIEAEVRSHTFSTSTNAAATFAHGLAGGAPSIVFFMTTSGTATGIQINGNFSLGAAMSSSSRWSLCVSAADGQTTAANQDTLSRQTTSKALQGIALGAAGTDGDLDFEADYNAPDATNISLNVSNAPGSANTSFSTLAIRGGNWALGATNKKNDGPGTQSIATGLTGTTKLLMLASWADTSSANAHQDAELSIGASDGTSEHSMLAIQEGNLGLVTGPVPTQTSNQFTVDKILKLGNSGVSGALTVTSEADFSSFASGNATVNWTTNDANAQQILWATVGDAAAAVPIVPILSSQWRQRRQ